ncbi:hypothetical protein GUJ93_ZPchr0014g46967 [Zizania palustris]|uniref:Uncharacterized protein n=1 Tax=Zizania palustris TaxID=103762 RepID=A0A8J5TGH0_ZIZPA|nr:hypothetical protein GUJ93_ZPchr0014g46967 [Zizania palustris]
MASLAGRITLQLAHELLGLLGAEIDGSNEAAAAAAAAAAARRSLLGAGLFSPGSCRGLLAAAVSVGNAARCKTTFPTVADADADASSAKATISFTVVTCSGTIPSHSSSSSSSSDSDSYSDSDSDSAAGSETISHLSSSGSDAI